MYYFVYKTTNKVNNKFYIGCHTTENLNDGYLGSGKFLKKAIKKYGEENFTREIIKFFDNERDMYKYEHKIVNENFIKSKDNYNSALGGKGGFLGNTEQRSLKLSEAAKNKVMAIDKTTGKKVKIEHDVFINNKERYVGSTKDMSVVKDKKGNIISVPTDEFKNSNEYIGLTKGIAVVKDKSGNVLTVSVDDERLKTGELVGITKGCKQTEESNIKRSNTLKGRQLIEAHRLVVCPNCGKEMILGNFVRWHKDGKCLKK